MSVLLRFEHLHFKKNQIKVVTVLFTPIHLKWRPVISLEKPDYS